MNDRRVEIQQRIEIHKERLRRKMSAPGGLIHFVRMFWEVLHPNRKLAEGWALYALCLHLEAISYGKIKRLLINIPPGSAKSLMLNVFWVAWEWVALGRTSLQYLSFSYSSALTYRDNQIFADLLKHPFFRDIWGDHIPGLRETGKVKVLNDNRGWKHASSVLGSTTGLRADRVLLDDPSNVKDVESKTIREKTATWFLEAMTNRVNDENSAIVVIMQRVHEDDVSGIILARDDRLGFEHLCIPAEFGESEPCQTSIGWKDPRTTPGEYFFPERFSAETMEAEKRKGNFYWYSQYMQTPEPRGGGLFKREYWQEYPVLDRMSGRMSYPKFDYILASLDPAFTDKDANDPSGMTVWGVFTASNGYPAVMLIDAWRERLVFRGNMPERWKGESDDDYRERCQTSFGLIEKVAFTCSKRGVDKLLIEAKGPGISVVQEMKRLYGGRKWSIEDINPGRLDKTARGERIQPIFANEQVYIPVIPDKRGDLVPPRNIQLVIDEMAIFPNGKYDDLTDSCTQGLHWLRKRNFLNTKDEINRSERSAMKHVDVWSDKPLYPA